MKPKDKKSQCIAVKHEKSAIYTMAKAVETVDSGTIHGQYSQRKIQLTSQ